MGLVGIFFASVGMVFSKFCIKSSIPNLVIDEIVDPEN